MLKTVCHFWHCLNCPNTWDFKNCLTVVVHLQVDCWVNNHSSWWGQQWAHQWLLSFSALCLTGSILGPFWVLFITGFGCTRPHYISVMSPTAPLAPLIGFTCWLPERVFCSYSQQKPRSFQFVHVWRVGAVWAGQLSRTDVSSMTSLFSGHIVTTQRTKQVPK